MFGEGQGSSDHTKRSALSVITDFYLNPHRISLISHVVKDLMSFCESPSKCQQRHFGASSSDLGGGCRFSPHVRHLVVVWCVAFSPANRSAFHLCPEGGWFMTSTSVFGMLLPVQLMSRDRLLHTLTQGLLCQSWLCLRCDVCFL